MIISSKHILATAVISLLSLSIPANAQGDDGSGSIPTDIEGIRLVNGTYGNHMGRVEVLYNGTWGTICDDFWSYSDARVACRMLGYEDAVCAVSSARFGSAETSVPILMDNMLCRGSEEVLDHCDFNGWLNHGCTHREDAGVICEDPSLIGALQNIQLIESSTKSLTIGWTIPAFPKGVERILFRFSYKSEAESFTRIRFFYPTSDEAVINRTGAAINYTLPFLQRDTAYSIQIRAEARYRRSPFLCSSYLTGNYSDVFVFRTNNTLKQSNIPIRLIPPQSGLDFMGRLEVFHNNVWGTVCDDLFSTSEANVVCGMLNYTDGSLCAVRSARFGEGEGRIWLDNVDCDSSDEILEECSFRPWGQNNCDHGDDVGVICRPRNYLKPVENLTVTHVASTSITIRWDPYEFPSEASQSQFRLQYITNAFTFIFPRIFIVSGSENEYTLSRLRFGSEYNISITPQVRFSQCRFSTLSGPASEEVSAVTQESAPTGAPTSFHVVVLNSTAIEVQYNLPVFSLRNGIIRGFKIFVEEADGDGSEMMFDVMGNSTLAYIVNGLKPATAYILSMLAYTVGDGPRGIHLTAITNSEGFDPIIVRFGINGNGLDKDTRFTFQTNLHIHCSPSHPANSTVDWFFSNGTKVGITDRNIREGHYANGTAVLQIASNRRLSYCDAGVYTCEVNTTSGRVHRKNFTLVINTTPPPPSRPSAVEIKKDSITIKWDEAQCTGGHVIQSFTIRYLETDSNPFFPFFGSFRYIRNIDPTQRNYTISGLDPETSYSIGVRVISVDGRSSIYSPSASILTLPPAPSAPRDVSVRVIRPLLVEVRWKVPAVTNGNIVHYIVYAIPLVSTEPTRGKRQTELATLPKTVKMVFPGSAVAGNVTLVDHSFTYQFRVSATVSVNGNINEGELSAITINTTVFIPKPGIPTPVNLRSTVSTNSSITLLWNYPPPPVETIESFMISYSAQVDWRSPRGTLVRFMDSGKATTTGSAVNISQLVPGTSYLFRVSAITQSGRGAEVNLVSQTRRPQSDNERLAFFQLRIGPIGSCVDFMDLTGNSTEKLYQVRKGLTLELMHLCPTCHLTNANIKDDEFSCRGRLTNFIVYRARIVGTDVYSAPDLVSLMQSWVGSGSASIAIQSSSRLHLDASCPTSLDTLRSPDCPFVSPPITTTTGAPETKPTSKKPEGTTTVKPPLPPSEPRSGLSASARAGEIGGIFVGVVIVLLLAVVIVLLSILLLKRWKPALPRIRNGNGHSRMTEDKTPFADIGSSSQEGGHLDFDTKDDVEKPSTDF